MPRPIQVLVSAPAGDAAGAAATVVTRIEALPDVTSARVAATTGERALIIVDYPGKPVDPPAHRAVTAIRALAPVAGATIGVTGVTADLIDELTALGDRLPWMVLYVVAVTLVLLFLAFGSVVLPVKAILMNIVSLGAAFGAVVFIFQDGHFASWLAITPTGVIEPTNPILMIVVLFGLATDYEVFLLSRVREEWDGGAGNAASVATGLQRTGAIITSAALLLIVVVVGFAAGQIAFVKLIGVGMIVAIVVDATLVRILLVPATMRLLGKWNWWAPGPLGRIYRRYGIRECRGANHRLRSRPVTIFETERLIVRRWTESDLDRIFAIYSRWDVQRWLGAQPRAMVDPAEAVTALRRWTALCDESADRYGCWAIEVADSGIAAGSVLLKPLPNSDGSPASDIEVGWHLHPDSWGNGYATEAARGAITRGFATGLSEVFAVVKPGNDPSMAVCRRLGMASIGRTDRWYGLEVEAFRLVNTGRERGDASQEGR